MRLARGRWGWAGVRLARPEVSQGSDEVSQGSAWGWLGGRGWVRSARGQIASVRGGQDQLGVSQGSGVGQGLGVS